MFNEGSLLSAGARQMLGLNHTGTCTCPTKTTGIIDSCEGNLLVENSVVDFIAIITI